MKAASVLSTPRLELIVEHILSSRQITRFDQSLLMKMFSSGCPTEQERSLLDRLYDALRVGRLHVVD